MDHLCKQPNGNYCIYSTVTDRPNCINITLEAFRKRGLIYHLFLQGYDEDDFKNAITIQEYCERMYGAGEDYFSAYHFDMSDFDFQKLVDKMTKPTNVFETTTTLYYDIDGKIIVKKGWKCEE